MQEHFIQFRSFRKNFSDILFSQTRNEFDTTMNKQRVIGHDNGTTGGYLGRANPMEIFHILNDIKFEEDFHSLTDVKELIKKYYNDIKRDIDWIEEVEGEWKIKSKAKRKKGRKI